VNPDIAVFTTRKIFPGAKALAVKAIMVGGAMPYRLGLSETILIFNSIRILSVILRDFYKNYRKLNRNAVRKKSW